MNPFLNNVNSNSISISNNSSTNNPFYQQQQPQQQPQQQQQFYQQQQQPQQQQPPPPQQQQQQHVYHQQYYQQAQDQQYGYHGQQHHHQLQQQQQHSYAPTQQLPTHQQHIYTTQPLQQQQVQSQLAPLSTTTSNDWIPNSNDKDILDKWFDGLDNTRKDSIDIKTAVPFLKRSQLTSAILLNIWNLVDKSNSVINREQFYKIIRLISVLKSPVYSGTEGSPELYYNTNNSVIPLYDMSDNNNLLSTPTTSANNTADYSPSPRNDFMSPVVQSSNFSSIEQTEIPTLIMNTIINSNDDNDEFTDFTGADNNNVTQSSIQPSNSIMHDMINLSFSSETSLPPSSTQPTDDDGWDDDEMGDFVGPTTDVIPDIKHQTTNIEIDLLGPPVTYATTYGSANPRISALDDLIESDLKIEKEEWGDFEEVPTTIESISVPAGPLVTEDESSQALAEVTFNVATTPAVDLFTFSPAPESDHFSSTLSVDIPIKSISETFINDNADPFAEYDDFGDFADSTNSPVHHSSDTSKPMMTPTNLDLNEITTTLDTSLPDMLLQISPTIISAANFSSPVDLFNLSPLTPSTNKKRESLTMELKPEYKAQSITDLERLAVTLSVKCLYNESYACILQANALRLIDEMNESKKKAVENDDLELALKLKKDIQEKSKYLATKSDETSWINAMASGIKGEKLQSLNELVEAFNPTIALKFRNKFLDNIPKSSAPVEERMQFYASALRSIRIITAIYTSHSDHPKMWKDSLTHISTYVSSSLSIFQNFQLLDNDDKVKLLKHDTMDTYIKGIISMAEVGLWISASCIEAFIDEEYVNLFIKQITNLFNIIRNIIPLDDNMKNKMKDINEVLRIGTVFSVRDLTEFCNITLRPIYISNKNNSNSNENDIVIYDVESIIINGIPYMLLAYNFTSKLFNSKALRIETKY